MFTVLRFFALQNLGEVTSPPVINADNSVTLTYENGDVCPTDKSKKLKTQIVFKCEHGSKVS